MHKALRCTCSQTPPLLSPSFLISFDITQSLLLDLCCCNPLSLLLIGVECNSFCSSVHLHYATNHISLYFFLWCITPDYCCLVDRSVDLGSAVASFFQHFSCPGSSLFVPSPLVRLASIAVGDHGAFSFRYKNLNNSRSFRFASEKFADHSS